jgi:excisionase family DNA binding protein
MDSKKLAYSIEEAAQAARLGRSTLFHAIAWQQLRAVKSGTRTLVLANDLRAFLLSLPAKDQKAGHRGTRR